MLANVSSVRNIIIRRWKALETSTANGGWSMARYQDLIGTQDVGLSSEPERPTVARADLGRLRLREATQRP